MFLNLTHRWSWLPAGVTDVLQQSVHRPLTKSSALETNSSLPTDPVPLGLCSNITGTNPNNFRALSSTRLSWAPLVAGKVEGTGRAEPLGAMWSTLLTDGTPLALPY